MPKLERDYQAGLIKRIEKNFPGCLVLKNDTSYLQGIPDLSIFWKDRWAVLEVKKDAKSDKQPNQDYYVGLLNEMSFSAFIYPENEEEVLDALRQAFTSSRTSRNSKR